MNTTHRRVARRIATLSIAAGMAAAGALTSTPAQALPPQPGSVPHINFGDTRDVGLVRLHVDYPTKVGDASIYETRVKICNLGTEKRWVGPDTFSYTVAKYDTRFYNPHGGYIYKGLANQWLAPRACATGSLVNTGKEPAQLAFYDNWTNRRVDILPATEWEGILKVGYPKSDGTSGYHGDFTGDKRADVIGLKNNTLITYQTNTGPTLVTKGVLKHNLPYPTTMNFVAKLPDIDKNGATDLLVRDTNGTMFLQKMMGKGRAGDARIIGHDFQNMQLLTVVDDVTGDSWPELYGRNAKKQLVRYTVTPTGIRSGAVVGYNWGSITRILSVGDFSGDGINDLLATTTDGRLMRYTLNRSGAITSTRQVGHGWNQMGLAFSPGDMNQDGRRDMVGIRNDSKLYFYANLGSGRWGTAKQIGHGWTGFKAIA